jgi:hypothetical protein
MRLRAQRREVLPNMAASFRSDSWLAGVDAGAVGGYRRHVNVLFAVLAAGVGSVHQGPVDRLLKRGPVRMLRVGPTWPGLHQGLVTRNVPSDRRAWRDHPVHPIPGTSRPVVATSRSPVAGWSAGFRALITELETLSQQIADNDPRWNR